MFWRILSTLVIIGLSMALVVDVMHHDTVQVIIDLVFLLGNALILIFDKD